MKRSIFLDMDGVLADFVTAALAACGKTDWTPEQITSWRMHEMLGISEGEFWDAQDRRPDFWYNLKPYPNIELFVDTLRTFGDVYFSTSPSLHNRCASDKFIWLRHTLGSWTTGRCMIGKPKHLLAGFDRLLIDDSQPNIDAWQQAGGQAILFPRAWNNGGHMPETAAQIQVINQVRAWSNS